MDSITSLYVFEPLFWQDLKVTGGRYEEGTNYTIEEKIGEGSYGAVSRAKDLQTGKLFTIKQVFTHPSHVIREQGSDDSYLSVLLVAVVGLAVSANAWLNNNFWRHLPSKAG